MEVFLITGSNASSIRTNTSLLVAFGLRLLGLETVHIQLTGRDEQPILRGEMPAPFATAWFSAIERPPSSAAIWDWIGQSATAEAVVIDLGVSAFEHGWIADPVFRILLPLATGEADVERVGRDFHAIAAALVPSGLVLPWILPVGWPPVMEPSDFKPVLDRALTRSGLPAPPSDRVIPPGGISTFEVRSAPPVVDGRISLSPKVATATEGIAYGMLKAMGSSLLPVPDDAF
ncbi:hypothetical protein [Bosea beijingensis]